MHISIQYHYFVLLNLLYHKLEIFHTNELTKLIGDTKKEWPNEATLKSHGMLLKGGYIKQMASGIFTLMPLGKRVSAKIENIIREKMS